MPDTDTVDETLLLLPNLTDEALTDLGDIAVQRDWGQVYQMVDMERSRRTHARQRRE